MQIMRTKRSNTISFEHQLLRKLKAKNLKLIYKKLDKEYQANLDPSGWVAPFSEKNKKPEDNLESISKWFEDYLQVRPSGSTLKQTFVKDKDDQ